MKHLLRPDRSARTEARDLLAGLIAGFAAGAIAGIIGTAEYVACDSTEQQPIWVAPAHHYPAREAQTTDPASKVRAESVVQRYVDSLLPALQHLEPGKYCITVESGIVGPLSALTRCPADAWLTFMIEP